MRDIAAAIAVRFVLAAGLAVLLMARSAGAQQLTVLPVTIQMAPGQMAAALTVVNQGDRETAIQVRAYVWNQSADGSEQVTPSDEILASPPLGTLAPGATQVVRLVLRRPPDAHEGTYRILLDQIPAPAQPGTVRVALRLSIPIFAEPPVRAVPHVQFRVEREAGQSYLVASNDGARHETFREIRLATGKGETLRIEPGASPYVLAGATRRWRILAPSGPPAGAALHLTARAEAAGAVDQIVSVVARP